MPPNHATPKMPKPTIPKETPWLSLHAAAKALGQTRHTVLVRAVAGELKARYVNGQVLVSRQSVERVLADRGDSEGVVEPEDVDSRQVA